MSRVALIGSGNLGSYFSKVISVSHAVDSYSRKNGQTIDYDLINSEDYDFIILAISDNAIESVSNAIRNFDGIIIHNSGSVSIDALAKHSKRAVLYPLQTFSKTKTISNEDFKIFVEGNSLEVTNEILSFTGTFHQQVSNLTSEERLKLHVSAVIACNFSNHLLQLSDKLLSEINLDLKSIEPLIRETFEKAIDIGPKNAQTGPASRKDSQTLEAHLALLKNDQNLMDIYQSLTKSIILHASKP